MRSGRRWRLGGKTCDKRLQEGVVVLEGFDRAVVGLLVVFLTSLGSVEDRTQSLDAGADDMVRKPFAFPELAARIRAVMRRRTRVARAIAGRGPGDGSPFAQRSGHAIDLSPQEFGLLEFLMRNAGHSVSRTTMIEQVWRLNVDTMTNVVDVYVNYLRRKMDSGFDHPLIRTIRGTG